MSGYEERGICPLCQQTESFQHIVQECSSRERETIWEAAKDLWRRRYTDDLPTSTGAILGCGLASFTTENGKSDAAKNRLYQILISESAHLVWVLRCERRIQGSDEYDHSEWTVCNRWYRKMNERMQIDCLLTTGTSSKGRP